ncbi:TetR/AcrR family transcriptional regulator [Paroceanicella profunda]|uniref:TetR/AcrR family transcriptional regulator n=1 Tax=Paroceanicella profunda TaxID=2579971 RepID=A0A5B8FWH2_9RHOB|nr:TetR/AcrR family transcriptional regulator [Paroceanicella profunda]QDL92855.1 TetR/AcrR family transcriptional regulator [Paroceanicella profunda]
MADDEKTGRRGYHHGNLREALVDAAIALIEERGPQGFTIAEAARAAGVSPAAPYRHFKGREELIAEVARRGFLIFAEQLEAARARAPGSPLRAFEAVGRAYLDFARTHPGHYIAMFESGLSIAGSADLNDAAGRAIGVLNRSAEQLFAHLPPEKRPPTSMVSHHIWALSHGVVELFTRGGPGRRAPFSPEELLESGSAIYLRGLGLLPDFD